MMVISAEVSWTQSQAHPGLLAPFNLPPPRPDEVAKIHFGVDVSVEALARNDAKAEAFNVLIDHFGPECVKYDHAQLAATVAGIEKLLDRIRTIASRLNQVEPTIVVD